MPHVVPPEVLDACVLELAGPPDRRRRDEFYGLRRELLDEVGPSVVSINGAAASLAVSEFMLAATGVRAPEPPAHVQRPDRQGDCVDGRTSETCVRYSLTRPVVWADHPRCASGGVGAWRSIGAATAVPADVARGIG